MTRMSLFLIAVVILLVATVWVLRYFLFPAKTGLAKAQVGDAIFQVEIANTISQQAKGLMGRTSLDADKGMLFIFTAPRMPSFIMQGMYISLDMIWIYGGKVVDISKNLPPDSGILPKQYKPTSVVDMVLEVNAGASDAGGIKVGDSVIVTYE